MHPVDFRIIQGVMTKNFKKREQENKERQMLKQEKSLLKNLIKGNSAVRSPLVKVVRSSPFNSNDNLTESRQKISPIPKLNIQLSRASHL